MPVISVTLLPGYSSEAESRLVQRVAIAARSVIAAAPAGTTVFVQHANTYQRDGKVFGRGGARGPTRRPWSMIFSIGCSSATCQLPKRCWHRTSR